jgi:hypothetical protein
MVHFRGGEQTTQRGLAAAGEELRHPVHLNDVEANAHDHGAPKLDVPADGATPLPAWGRTPILRAPMARPRTWFRSKVLLATVAGAVAGVAVGWLLVLVLLRRSTP